jgi:hypothetical protein
MFLYLLLEMNTRYIANGSGIMKMTPNQLGVTQLGVRRIGKSKITPPSKNSTSHYLLLSQNLPPTPLLITQASGASPY